MSGHRTDATGDTSPHERPDIDPAHALSDVLAGAGTDSATAVAELERIGPLPEGFEPLRRSLIDHLQLLDATTAGIKASTAATRSILNSTQDAVFGVGHDGTCLFANDRVHDLLGVPAGALFGTLVHDTVHRRFVGIDRPDSCRFCDLSDDGFVDLYNEVILAADDEPRDVDHHAFAVDSGQASTGWVVRLVDVTARRNVERRYEALVSTIPVGVYTTTRDGTVVFANDRLLEIIDSSRDELLGTPITRTVHPADVDRYRHTIGAAFDDDRAFVLEHRVVRPGGDTTWVLSTGDVDRGRRGEAIGINGVYADITELKAAQSELERLNRTLESRVAQRTAELTDANTELQRSMEQLRRTQHALVEGEKMAALGNLVAGLAHELNTPVGVSRGAASHLDATVTRLRRALDRNEGHDELRRLADALHDAADLVVTNLDRSSDLVARFKRVSVDSTAREHRRFALRGNIVDAIANLRREFESDGINVYVDCDDDLEILGDPGTFTQMHTIVAANTLAHAFPTSFEGVRRFDVDVTVEGDSLTIDYRDNGVGADDDTRRQLFEPFFTTKRHKGGTGLGMHILYLLVTQHLGGSVTCRPNDPRGLAVRVQLPFARD